MLKNYIKIAFRNLVRDRAFSVLNIAGLAVGLASVIMIFGYVRYELSYDKSYSNHPQVYRLLQETQKGNTDQVRLHTNVGLAQVLQKEFPAIVAFTSLGRFDFQFKYHNEMVKLDALEGGAGFFKLFNFPFISGNPATALAAPGTAVITESTAKKFFAGKNPLGSFITDNNGKVRRITGVIKDIPLNNHITGDIIISSVDELILKEPLNMVNYTSLPQYVLLAKNTNAYTLEQHFAAIYKKYHFPAGLTVHLQPVTAIHLYSHSEDEITPNSDIKYVYIFSSIALLILFIACINYVNLTTARSLQRAREIGLRKVLGAVKAQLIIQFLTESFLFFLVSTLLATLLAYGLWPVFSAKITAYQHVLPLFDAKLAGAVFLLFLLGGLLSGAYPAFFLSSLQPVKVLKGLSKFGINVSLRKALVVLQFAISGVLIISTIIVHQQLNYINNAPLGFNKDHLIAIPFFVRNSHVRVFKNELVKNSHIKSASVASWEIGTSYGSWTTTKDGKDTAKEVKYEIINADPDFIKTAGIKLLQGRDFSTSHANDMVNLDSLWRKHLPADVYNRALLAQSVILNEQAVKSLYLDHPDGVTLKAGAIKGTVIGVVQNFNGMSLHQQIAPLIIQCSPVQEFGQMYIRIAPTDTRGTLSFIEKQWKHFYPDHNFEFAFTDDKLQQLYTADIRLGALFGIFSTLSIVIACIGLFGLISLTVQNRVKEIGIRKVLGASIVDITRLISTDFLILVLLSFTVSSPIAWYAMNKWLQDFAYRVNIQWWVFLIACGIAVIIALVTLSFQAIKAAMANPVNSLRSE